MFTKKLVSIVSLSVLAGVTALATISGTFAWLNRNASINNQSKIAGWSQSAYFGGGTGVDGDPYIINKPVHLYNLAWLQYIGYFNEGQNADGTGAVSSSNQAYFRLDVDLDMSTFNSALPPIGTEKYPFIGNFNGNGHTISSVTISNDFKETSKHPSVVTSISNADVVGLFGVVGKMSGQSFTYTTSINEIKDLGILDSTIKSSSSNTLVGIAAGYVNGKLENVAINDSNLYTKVNANPMTSITDNVSDYSLVGYATDGCKKKMRLRSDDANIPILENPNTDQGGHNWGGSINMQDMFTYLRSQVDSSTAYTYSTAETITVDNNGHEGEPNITSRGTNSAYTSSFGGEYYRYHGKKGTADGKEYASYTFVRSSGNSNFNTYNSNDAQYICLYGGGEKRGATSSGNATKTVTINGKFFRIRNNNTDHYLSYKGSISDQTNTNNASGWRWEGNYIKTTYNNSEYYLSISNSALAGTTTKSTQWAYDSEKGVFYTINSSGDYYIYYNSGWKVGSLSYYTIYDDTKNGYVNNGNSYYLANLSNTATTQWGYGQMGNSTGYGYNDLSNSGQWIGYYSSSYKAQCYSDSKYCFHLESGLDEGTGKLVAVNGNTRYYLYHTGSASAYFSSSTTANDGDTFTIEKHTSAYTTQNIKVVTYSGSASESNVPTYYDTYPTYFPLTREKNEQGQYTGSAKPDTNNTGYVISGNNLTDSTQGPYGDIRVSYFDMSNLNNALNQSSYDDNKLEVVTRTSVRGDNGNYTDSGWTRISDEKNKNNNSVSSTLSNKFGNKKDYKSELRLNKYKTSRTDMGSTLGGGDGNIYGLHFMDAAISTNHLIEIPNAIVYDGKTIVDGEVVGSEYQNYQLPQDSIDFNLKDQGYINFFAGSYFTNNNTFFSLHEIERDANNKITNIKEIKKVYAPLTGDPSEDNPYVYSYDGNRPAGYTNDDKLAFDVDWITNPTIVTNAVYYFEIPVNGGEYALGSVSGKNGAYLMYLDIGAGIGNFKDITTTEQISTTVKDSEYPLGVDFQAFEAGSSRAKVEGGKTAAVEIDTGKQTQSLNYTLASTTLTVKASDNVNPALSTEYSDTGITVKKQLNGGNPTDMNFEPPDLYTMEDNKETQEKFNIFTSTVSRAVNETIELTGGEAGLTVQLPTPVASTGFTITGAINYVKESGPATVDASTGLVTFTGNGTVTITMTYTETKTDVEEWSSASSVVADDTEGQIFNYRFRDYDDPNITVRYVYDGVNKTYTLYITAVNDTVLYINNNGLPPEGYTVIVVVNGDTAHQTELTSASTSISSITITGSGSN